MRSFLLTSTFIFSMGLATEIFADHTLSALRRDYDAQREQLEDEYEARRDAVRYDYHRQRDELREERKCVQRMDSHPTRTHRLRIINRQLAALAKDYSARKRALSDWYDEERDILREHYELAKRNARSSPSVFVTPRPRPSHHGTHAAGCGCSACQCPEAVPVPAFRTPHAAHGPPRGYPAELPRHHRKDRIDWASLVLSLLLD